MTAVILGNETATAESIQGVTRTSLDANWRFRELPRPNFPPHRQLPWLPAQVPGCAHLDLQREGVIPDPFQRIHERDVEWVDNTAWEYETTFDLSELPAGDQYIKFYGLDTVAEVELNGELIGSTDNMYIAHQFPVTHVLKVGENLLRVVFRSALLTGSERQAAFENYYGQQMPEQWDWWTSRSFLRKAQYMYGWDWGPVLMGAGIWQRVELVTVSTAEIVEWKYDYDLSDDIAKIRVSANVNRVNAGSDLQLNVSIDGHGAQSSVEANVDPGTGAISVTLPEFDLPIELWQPNGLGAQPLYTISLLLKSEVEGITVDTVSEKIGFRTLELLHEPDADGKGEGFAFQVNGNKVFAKGANWIPNDSFPSRIGEYDIRQRMTQARDAGFNMLRIWGGGFYESDLFYQIADELGLLVWQDFPYGCAYYPDDPHYADAARVEATAAVKRIRHHVSLALWCGNNENHTMYQGPWGGIRPKRFLGAILYHDVLPKVVAAEDPKTPYWPGSPTGGEDYNSQDFGDCHNWDVWHGRGDWIYYTTNTSRFCSEFGFAASCGQAAWDYVLSPADRSSRSPVVQWHDKTRKGYETYLGYVAIHYPDPQTIEELVYHTQLNQAEALKYGVEHYRRIKGRCWGTLYWQLNDCWPVQSWAVIDSLGEPKAAYYATKRFYAPVLLSLVREENVFSVHLVNDPLTQISGRLDFSLVAFDGKVLFTESSDVVVEPNSSTVVATISIPDLAAAVNEAVVHAQFVPSDGSAPVENFVLLSEPKELTNPKPTFTTQSEVVADGVLKLTISANVFAPYVWISAEDHTPLTLSDNFFHLLPGVTREILVSTVNADARPIADISISVRAFEAPVK